MNAMMADMAIVELTPHTGAMASSTNDWLNFPLMISTDPPTAPNTQVEMNLHNYLQADATVYYYCWDLNGQLTNLATIGGDEAPAAC